MGNSINPVDGGGGRAGGAGRMSGAEAMRGGANASANNSNMADSMSKSLTTGGKAIFDTPGAQQDFQKGMQSAIGNLVEGAKSGDTEKMTKGITELISLLTGLAGAQGKKSGGGQESAEKSGGGSGGQKAQGGQGAGPAAGASGAGGADDKKKKMMELIQMMLAMGIPPEMIGKLLEAMGMPAQEAQQLMSQAQQANGEDKAGDKSTAQQPLRQGGIPA